MSIFLKRKRREGGGGREKIGGKRRKKDYRNLYPNQLIKNEAQSAKGRNMEIGFHSKETG